jgi:hypothetical protein
MISEGFGVDAVFFEFLDSCKIPWRLTLHGVLKGADLAKEGDFEGKIGVFGVKKG